MSEKKTYRVVITDYDFESLEEIERALNKINAQLIPAQCQSEDEVIQLAKEADALINEYYHPVSRRVIENLKRCKVIVRTGIGIDTIDVQAATDNHICVANVPEYCLDEVAEHALGLVTALARKLCLLNDSVKKGYWNWNPAKPMFKIKGQTLGLVGFGKIGRVLAKKAKGLGMSLIYFDPYVDYRIGEKEGVRAVSFDRLLKVSDFVSIHVPSNGETRGMFGEKEFRTMKKSAYIINTSRGAVVDNGVLYEALSQGWIAGAGLDVMRKEPPDKREPLLSLRNLIITPHCAWYSEDSVTELRTVAGEEVVRVLSGKKPLFLVNPEVLKQVNLK